jgi:T-complex protein 1 subunit theta
VLRNIQAVSELSDLVRSSFGPNGLFFPFYSTFPLPCPRKNNMIANLDPGRNKLLINHLGRLFVTSDAATIIRELEVVHPAAKLLVMASQAQETEVSIFSPHIVFPLSFDLPIPSLLFLDTSFYLLSV